MPVAASLALIPRFRGQAVPRARQFRFTGTILIPAPPGNQGSASAI